jgi:serine/threonine-protein kinase
LERELGGGGMSRVFVATETALGRKVVVKVLSDELAGSLIAERFKREIQLAAGLQHPNIVPLLTAGSAGDLPFYTMPLVEGESLRSILQRDGELPVRDAIAILRDVARALDYAHSRGVVHRDIKPDNVLRSSDYAVVTDFGVAKALIAARSGAETITQLGVAIGTPAYMSPEQVAGDNVDHRADIYAFGCMAYELLTAAPPFRDTTAPALFAAHAARQPTPLADIRSTVPPPLASLVTRCLEKRPSDRPQSAREIIDALDAVATPGAGTATSANLVARRRAVRIGAAAVVAAPLLAVLAFWALRPPSTAVSDSVVAVTPFRVGGADPSLRTLREGMLDLISAKLSGNMRAIDPRTLLGAWRKRGGTDATDLVQTDALALSTQLGAGRLLQGQIVGTPEHVVISATLVAAPSGRARATASVTGAQSQLALLVDSLVAELFVQEAGTSELQSRQLAGIPFGALQAYLTAESFYRKGRYKDAEDALVRALEIDSTFALASLKLTIVSGWTGGHVGLGRRLALRQFDKLGPRERLLLNGDDPRWLRGRRLTCMEKRSAEERGLVESPDMPELWYYLGDNLTHCGWVMNDRDVWQHALAAFERARAVDSTFAPAREHLAMLHWLLGDSARAQAALAEMQADSSDLLGWTRFLIGWMPDSAERRRFIDRQMVRPTVIPNLLPVTPIFFSQYVHDGETALTAAQRDAATDRDRARVAVVERKIALNRGQPARAAAATQAAGSPASAPILDAVFWEGDSTAAAEALPIASRAYSAKPRQDSLAPWADDIFAVAQSEAARQDTTHLRRAIALLRGMKPPADRPWLANPLMARALLLDLQLATQLRRGDALTLLERADSLLRQGPPDETFLYCGGLIVSRIWQSRGDLHRAYTAIKRVTFEPASPLYYSTYHLERARIAAALGETKDAIAEYTYYLNLRYAPEPSLRAQVASVRAELERLQKSAR